MNKKTIITVIFSALAGSLLGGILVGFTVIYFLTQFFSNASLSSSSYHLGLNISVLENIRNGSTEKAIKQLEQDARRNLITVGNYDGQLKKKKKKSVFRSIGAAKEYFEHHPVDYLNEDEKILFDHAFSKIGESTNSKSLNQALD